MVLAQDTGAQLGALYPAVAAVLVALIGLIGTLLSRRSSREPKVDTSESQDSGVLLAALKEALADAAVWKDRALRCEARESAREPRSRRDQA